MSRMINVQRKSHGCTDILILRTHAITGHSQKMLRLLVGIGLIVYGVAMVSDTR